MSKTIKVLIVDDSSVIRQMFSAILSEDPDIEVVGVAVDPYDAREKIKLLNPDVITLDIEMPKMDGLTFLEKIMTLRPMPVVMVSTLTQKGADSTIRALEIGAVDYVAKPLENDAENNFSLLRAELLTKVKSAGLAKVRAYNKSSIDNATIINIPTEKIIRRNLIAIGASTGGVEALREVLCRMPINSPPIVVVQHMPPKFTASFANRLNNICLVTVQEASDGQEIMPGNVYIAEGGKHLRVNKHGKKYICSVKEGESVSGHCPSVDVMFASISENVGGDVVGVILTGMGKDGAAGMLKMKNAGAVNIGQNQETCVVYGMPKEAKANGAVDIEVPLIEISEAIIKLCLEYKE
jgi:two-component system chemotaxis response regulator CheB